MRLPGYAVGERIHQGNSVVYRARRESDGAPVVLKLLRGDRPTPRQLAAARREHDILRGLDLPGVVRPLDLVPYDNGPALVLEDFGAESLASIIRGGLELEVFLRLGMALASGLSGIHQRSIIHKDIKPANIVVNLRTGEIKYIDFNTASLLRRESEEAQEGTLEGSLPYLSPEQTGRMNRRVDFRSDFYSLGVTFYEMLVGDVPFHGSDALELVHCHLAKTPVPPHERRPSVPRVVSDIVMKLLAKSAEDRYQSAHGLREDLRRCLESLRATGQVPSFPLAENDHPDRFQVSQRLYGRSVDVAALLAAQARASTGRSELFLVAGPSGIGKSALIREVEKPIAGSRGYFITGKFDQLKRNVPYAPIIQAFRELVRQLLGEGEARVASWAERLRAALGQNGRVITDVIPEVELLVGPQPPVEDLGPTEAMNRFDLVFEAFLAVFTQPEHPLAMFLDDLQWADLSSLRLLEVLVTSPDSHCLFVVGAYRDNEVDPSHPLVAMTERARKAGATIATLTLAPLSADETLALVADTLHTDAERALPLARVVTEKTAGNPFFVNEFLSTLHEEELLWLDRERGAYAWDLDRIRDRAMTDDVVQLMAQKLGRLPEQSRHLVTLAAAIGASFDLSLLSVVAEKGLIATARDLWPAVEVGLVLPLDEGYKFVLAYESEDAIAGEPDVRFAFLHDRVQQAAYSLIGDDEKVGWHLRVGRLLLAKRGSQRGELLFDIANHLNRAASAIVAPDERVRLAELDLEAGRRASSSTAYQPALQYLEHGARMLPDDAWGTHYDLAFGLHLERGRCLYLSGEHARANEVFSELTGHAKSVVQRAQVLVIQMQMFQTMGDTQGVVRLGIEALGLLGVTLPLAPRPEDDAREIARIGELLAGRTVDELYDLPDMTDEKDLAVMSLLAFMGPAGYVMIQTLPGLWQHAVLLSTRYTLEHGNSKLCAYGHLCYGMILGPGVGQFETAHAWGRLGIRIAEKFGDRAFICMATYLHGAFLDVWREHLDSSMRLVDRAFQLGIDSGNLLWSAFSHAHVGMTLPQRGDALDDVLRGERRCLEFAERLKYVDIARYYRASIQWALALQGQTPNPASFDDGRFAEEEFFAESAGTAFHIPFLHAHTVKTHLCLVFGDHAGARRHADLGAQLAPGGFGLYLTVEHWFYAALARLVPVRAGADDAAAALAGVAPHREKLALWADNCPTSTGCRRELVEAEAARLAGRGDEALELYEAAIAGARRNRFPQIEALAGELAARFCSATGRTRLARSYLGDAHRAYATWGATAKVEALEAEHPDLLSKQSSVITQTRLRAGTEAPTSTSSTSGSRNASDQFDLTTVLKATQALAGEIVLDRLVDKLMTIALENAGATRGVLVLTDGTRLFVEAEHWVDGQASHAKVALDDRSDLSHAMVHYAARTAETVLLTEDLREGRFGKDPYLAKVRPASALAAPLVEQGKVLGVLYLENAHAGGAFTHERLLVLRMISAQAAGAIEKAQLYGRLERQNQELERKVEERTREIQQKNATLAETLSRLSTELAEAATYVRSLLPAPGPQRGGVNVDWRFVPSAELGGDALGYGFLPDGRFVFYVLDVCGHGTASAMLSIAALNVLQSGRLPGVDWTDPASVLRGLNEAFPARNGLFFTIWYGVYDPTTRDLAFASAGHPAAVLHLGAERAELGSPGPMIGIVPDVSFVTEHHRVEPNARLHVFSDGAYEVVSPAGEVLDYDAFLGELGRGAGLDRMIRFASHFRGAPSLEDDFTMMEIDFS